MLLEGLTWWVGVSEAGLWALRRRADPLHISRKELAVSEKRCLEAYAMRIYGKLQ